MQYSKSWIALKFLLGICTVMSIALWTYHQTVNSQFVWDSYHYLVKHVWYISNISGDNVIWMFLEATPYWHPLTWLSWALDYQIYGGLVSSGFHFTNNVLHALNSALVFLLTLVLFGLNNSASQGFPLRTDNHALIAGLFGSLLFAVHPQHVESVAWVAERKDLLFQLFLLLSMLTYVKYATCRVEKKSNWYYGTLGFFAFALLSKPMAITFPIVLLLIDVYPLRRTKLSKPLLQSIRQETVYDLIREKLPFFFLSMFLILITLLSQIDMYPKMSLDLRLLNAFNSILLYLNKCLLPFSFSPLYPYLVEPSERITWIAFLPIFGVLGLTVASVFAWRRNHQSWLIAWLFYLVTLLPVLGLVQAGEQGAADRFAYFPTLPAYLIIGSGILILLDKASPVSKALTLMAACILVLLLTGKTRQQIHVWKDPLSLWTYAVKTNPSNVTAHYNLGVILFREKEYEKAAVEFEKGASLPPNPISAALTLPSQAYKALTDIYLGRYDDALNDYLKLGEAVKTAANSSLNLDCIYFNSGWLSAQLGDFERAYELFGMVNPESQLWPDTSIWLEIITTETGKALNATAIPGFCTSVIN